MTLKLILRIDFKGGEGGAKGLQRCQLHRNSVSCTLHLCFVHQHTCMCCLYHADTHYDAERDLRRKRKEKEKKIEKFEDATKKKKKRESEIWCMYMSILSLYMQDKLYVVVM